jgi:hypothetical protein
MWLDKESQGKVCPKRGSGYSDLQIQNIHKRQLYDLN